MEKLYNENYSLISWKKWYENGQKKMEKTFKDGELISSKEWNIDGSVKE